MTITKSKSDLMRAKNAKDSEKKFDYIIDAISELVSATQALERRVQVIERRIRKLG